MKLSELRQIIKEEIQKLNESNPKKGRKSYYTMDNIGNSKYSISFYDGKATHKDGSPFYDLRIFKNKKKYEASKKELQKQGYIEENKMKKSELQHIIREEIERLNEGADWIILKSAGKDMAINSFDGFFMNHKDLSEPQYDIDSKEWKTIYKKLNSKDKATVDDVRKDIGR